jgi:1-aminocyclopropane-1-carboxylate deaminase/D-cysteine desulfhydrase-like pyridoxal-dependent ACC family enzyme
VSRARLGCWPTPLQRIGDRGGHYVKREDLCGFAFGGSKVRAIEPLIGDALSRGASSLVTGGRRDSNWVALTALAAARCGLACHCVLDPGPGTPLAMRLARRAGASLHAAPEPGAAAVNAAIAALTGELGPSAYAIPRAGAAPLGVEGYRAMARELAAQLPPGPADVVIAVGSGGAAAGLLLGFHELSAPDEAGAWHAVAPAGRDVRVVGVPVSKSAGEATAAVRRLLEQVLAARPDTGSPGPVPPDALLRRLLVLPGTGTRSPLADQLAARAGVLLDPVFTGPAWHAFCASRPWPAVVDDSRTAVLVASGGLPAYFDMLAGAADVRA